MRVRLGLTTACLTLAAAVTAAPIAAFGSNSSKPGPGPAAAALKAVGLSTDGTSLVRFAVASPSKVKAIGAVSGLSTDSKLIGIDYRVQDGALYGVGDAGGVYVLDTETAAAAKVSQLTVALDGTAFGVDFNPAADRLRVISNTGQNLRHNVNAGGVTLVDGVLTYTAPPATAVPAPGVTAAAYTNNDLDANTATTLFDLDTTLDQVDVQSPANSGILAATGKLGLDATGDTGFDIYSVVDAGRTIAVRGFAVIGSGLYEISLLSGQAQLIGAVGSPVSDLAIAIDSGS